MSPARVLLSASLAAVASLLVLAPHDALAAGTRVVHRPAPAQGTAIGVGLAPTTQPATTRYRSLGKKPGTGRSGSASLTVRALQRKSGDVDLEITTGKLDSSAAAPGELVKIQLKALTAAGEVEFTRNLKSEGGDGSARYTLENLRRGQKLQVQGNVTGIDGNRTDVVTVSETVRLRPDLRATKLDAPQRALVHAGVNIGATVTEANGDVGATSDCVLYADDKEIDRAADIWIDAGAVATCAFTVTFATVGTKQLRVALEQVTPREWDASDNSATATVEIVEPSEPMRYSASFQDYDYDYASKYSYSYRRSDGSWGSDYAYEYASSGWTQQGNMSAWTDKVVSFPLAKVSAELSTDGKTIDAFSLSDVPADWSWSYASGDWSYAYSCAYRYSADYGSVVQVCSYKYKYGETEYKQTSAYYNRYAGDVTYYSSGYSSYWELGYPATVWSWNYAGQNKRGTRETIGAKVELSIKITDGGNTYTASPELTLTPLSWSYSLPWTCWSYDYWDTQAQWCSQYTGKYDGSSGSAYKY